MNEDDDAPRYVPSKDAVTLSPHARDIARVCGMTEVEYARQVLKLREMKKHVLVQQGR